MAVKLASDFVRLSVTCKWISPWTLIFSKT